MIVGDIYCVILHSIILTVFKENWNLNFFKFILPREENWLKADLSKIMMIIKLNCKNLETILGSNLYMI